MEIYIVRHGDALPDVNDIDRKLSPKGKNQSKIVGKALKKLKVNFDVILTSNLKRAIQTAEIIAKEIKFKKEIEKTENLAPEADVNNLIENLKQYKEKNLNKILLVGHLPFLQYLVEKLISNGNININLKKGSLCRIDLEDFEKNITGSMIYLLPQEILKKIN